MDFGWRKYTLTEAAMDISINKPAKDYFKRQFEQWYSEQGTIQLEGRDLSDLEAAKLQPIDLGMPVMKEIGAKWLVDMADYIIDNPRFTVNGCLHSGITGAADDQMESDDDAQQDSDAEEQDSDNGSDYSSNSKRPE